MSDSLPIRPVWDRFAADPRRAPAMRASDADRDVAAEVVNAAFGDGRLDSLEHSERLQGVLQARTLGELVPLIQDVTIAARPAAAAPARRVRNAALSSWMALALLFNVIWVATWLFSASEPYYYWPIWPMIGTAIPVVIAWLAGRPGGRDADGER